MYFFIYSRQSTDFLSVFSLPRNMPASSDDESVASDVSDFEDDEEYEEPQKNDYCAARSLSS